MNTKKEPIKKNNLRQSNREAKSLTRQYIKTALLYLMKETSFDKITVTAIINRAGVSRAGFYRNYSSKEEVLEDISSSIYDKLADYYMQGFEGNNMYQRYVMLFSKLQESAEWFQLVLMLNSHQNYIFHTAAYVEQYLNPQTPEEHYLYIAVVHSQRAIIIDWFRNGMKESPEEMAKIFSNIFNEDVSLYIQSKMQ